MITAARKQNFAAYGIKSTPAAAWIRMNPDALRPYGKLSTIMHRCKIFTHLLPPVITVYKNRLEVKIMSYKRRSKMSIYETALRIYLENDSEMRKMWEYLYKQVETGIITETDAECIGEEIMIYGC